MRVLLLARAGEARSRLEAALAEAGAELLRAEDPGEADPADALALKPAAVLVALEPAIEDALERYDALLSDPGVLVIFDDAELAAQREGWDSARWVRHLAAKLNGHQDVLPPGPEPGGAALALEPLEETSPAGLEAAEPGPTNKPEPAIESEPESTIAPESAVETEPAIEPEPEPTVAFEPAVEPAPAPVSGAVADGDLASLLAVENMDWSSSAEMSEDALDLDPALAELLASSGLAREDGGDVDPADADQVDGAGEDAAEADAGDLPALDFDGGLDFTIAADDEAADAGSADADAAPAVDPLSLGSGFSLAEDDAPILSAPEPERVVDLDALAARLDGLSLADPDSYGHGVLRGAVVVEAGLGGPDPVRQLLGGLGEEFGRAVLVRLQLDGGRYDRLVQQMQRATALPVALAETGVVADAGIVYFLPPELVAVEERARLVFSDAGDVDADSYRVLPPADSAVVFLSGARAERVGSAMELAAAGALVLAQSPDSCYDSAAVDALVARGAHAAEPAELAQALLDRWP